MSLPEISIFIGAFLSMILFLFHIRLYKLCRWQEEFNKIDPFNGKIFYTINLAIALLFLLFAIISFIYAKDLAQCQGLAFGICFLYSLFWLWRFIWQLVYFKVPKNGATKAGVAINYSLRITFLLLFVAYFVPVLMRFLA
jgi:hypothetical protein